MTGRLMIRDGKYYAILSTKVNGKNKQIWKSLGLTVKGNKRLAEQMLNDLIYEEKEKRANDPEIYFTDYVKLWLEHIKPNIDEITYQGYESLINVHLIPYFEPKKIYVSEISVADLQEYVDYEFKNGRADGNGGLSAHSLRHHRNVLHQTLKFAQKNGLVTMNVCEFVDFPKMERFNSSFYTPDELNILFEATKDDVLCNLIKTAAIYGLRRSEVLGLKWDSINWGNNTITIKHTVTSLNGVIEKDKTKTASSYRSFPLLPEIAEIFQEQKEKEENNRKLLGGSYQENDYVFKWDDGHTFSPNFVTKHFNLILKENNLPKIRFHELRHSCASMLLNSGHNLEAVQKWMGHSDIKMTANIYGHLDMSEKLFLANDISRTLTKSC